MKKELVSNEWVMGDLQMHSMGHYTSDEKDLSFLLPASNRNGARAKIIETIINAG